MRWLMIITYVWTKPYVEMTALDSLWFLIQIGVVFGTGWLFFWRFVNRKR